MKKNKIFKSIFISLSNKMKNMFISTITLLARADRLFGVKNEYINLPINYFLENCGNVHRIVRRSTDFV